jgi:transposase
LTDAQWAAVRPRLPPQRPRTGRPARDHRTVLSAILWVLRTGAPWRDLPGRFGPWSPAWSRSRRWTAAGVWARVLATLQRAADRAGRFDWATHYVDGTVVRAHARGVAQHAAGAAGGQAHEALGRSRGGFSTKVHVRAEGGGKPLAVVVSGGEVCPNSAFLRPSRNGQANAERHRYRATDGTPARSACRSDTIRRPEARAPRPVHRCVG